MAASSWKINTVEAGDGAGLRDLFLRRVSQGADLLSFSEGGAAIDGTPRYAYGDALTLTRDGVTVFRGRVTAVRPAAAGAAESITYEAQGPWWYLANLVYQQSWSVYGQAVTRLLLSTDAEGAKIHAGAQLEDAVNYAISKGAPLTLVHDLDQELPAEELRDMTVAEIIVRLLRWHPDRVTWVDDSGAGSVLHIQKRSSLTAAELALTSESVRLGTTAIVPRYDLVPGYVKLIYERIDTIDGVETRVVSEDRYPLTGGDEFTAIVQTIDLQGGSTNIIKQRITTADIEVSSETWWKQHVPELNDAAISDLTVVPSSGAITPEEEGGLTYGKELVEGAIADWMSVNEAPVRVTARVSYKRSMPAGAEETVTARPVSVRLRSTDGDSKTYRIYGGGVAGETAPTGLAQALYTALATVQYQGRLSLAEEEALSSPWMGRVLNITGGAGAWATMNALIQSVDIDIDRGTTTLQFGPPAHLSAGDLVDLLRVGRKRVSYGPAIRTGGGAETPDEVGYKGASGAGGTVTNLEPMKTSWTLSGGETVTLDSYTLSGTPSENPTLQLRPLTVCVESDGSEKVVWVLASQEMNA